ncbi:GerAB/ArcD/ProY family transporter [Neobacillus sp. PS3-40]|uniref:GerAB/ArcD/ProY family transporter n=1 Tax=Neobacillus sp. PS3-40 TaxID=3070679 RepID=UPI0027E1AFDD|nr:GerAB/ArcD/ProY family transporter [Neobacillus sp. PS3-40]WML44220.1 GerAB/ArcD/ProY family transporter [Neobacillus sp. PS3-40]
MEKAKINGTQLFVLVVLFEMGSALVVGLATSAKQDAWIAVVLGMVGGAVLYLIYHRLFMFYPDIPLTSYVQKITGKYIGRFIAFLYIIYFMYVSARVLRDFGELLTTTIYSSTPLFIINTLMILTIIYAIQKGFEVIARVGELFFILVYILAIGGVLLVAFSGLVHVDNLRPILENGVMPVLKITVGQTLTFPFGEMVVFTMLLPYLNEPKKAKLVCLGGIILSGINITITTLVNIAVLGADLYARSPFPLLNTIGKIQIGNFIERLDVFFMLYLMVGGFFKITIFFYAALAGTADIFKFKSQKKLCFPIGLIILFASMTIASNYAEHAKEGLKVIPIYLHWPFQIIIPAILLIIAYFRNRKKQPQNQNQIQNQNQNLNQNQN